MTALQRLAFDLAKVALKRELRESMEDVFRFGPPGSVVLFGDPFPWWKAREEPLLLATQLRRGERGDPEGAGDDRDDVLAE